MSPKKLVKSKTKWLEHVVAIERVTKVVKGGKKMSFRAIIVVGNERGKVGVGVGKAGDVIGAVRKGVADGKKHIVKVPLTRHSSIPTLSNGRDGAASVLIRPAAPGTGVIALTIGETSSKATSPQSCDFRCSSPEVSKGSL